jgi:uncharacterized protein with GYD domain
MAKYLWRVTYTPQGAEGLRKEGGTARRAAVERLTAQAGGKLESFYFALGESDVYVIADLPDLKTATAVSLAVNAAGAAHIQTVVLLTPEEMDAASKQAVDYRPPGSGAK